MASKKEAKTKKISKKSVKKDIKKIPVVAGVEEDEDEEIGVVETKGKTKKPVEIDAADILPEVDEKAVDEENPLLAVEEEESEEEASLDDEDINPFGDKWEQ